jgi:hypothetical protein
MTTITFNNFGTFKLDDNDNLINLNAILATGNKLRIEKNLNPVSARYILGRKEFWAYISKLHQHLYGFKINFNLMQHYSNGHIKYGQLCRLVEYMILTKPGRHNSGTWVIPEVASWILYHIFDINIEDLQGNIDEAVIKLIQKKFYMAIESTTYAYIITDGTGYYRIGTSSDVQARVQQLQKGNPRYLDIIFTKKLTRCLIRLSFIRSKYDSFLEQNGWYYLKPEEVAKIISELLG